MKVSLGDFKAALALFETEFIGTMKTTMQKFLVGAALAASGKKVDEMLAPFVSKDDGMIDSDAIRAIVNAGLKQSGGEVEIPLSFGVLSSIGANPIVTRITKMDVDKFFDQTLPAVAKPTLQDGL